MITFDEQSMNGLGSMEDFKTVLSLPSNIKLSYIYTAVSPSRLLSYPPTSSYLKIIMYSYYFPLTDFIFLT